jgi:hypothetical protein
MNETRIAGKAAFVDPLPRRMRICLSAMGELAASSHAVSSFPGMR